MSTSQDEIYVDVPHLVSRQRKLGDALATGMMWILYSYLWAPLISLVAWLLGFEFAYNVMIRLGGLHTLPPLLIMYFSMLALILSSVVIWSLINRLRFSGQDRRKGVVPVTDTEIAEFFELEQSDLAAMREGEVFHLALNDNAGIERVELEDSTLGGDDPGGDRSHASGHG